MITFRNVRIPLLASAFLLSHAAFAQTPQLARRIQVDWQTFKSSQVSGNSAVYPPLAVMTKVEGTVRIDFVVTVDGKTKELGVLSGHPLLVQSALDAVRTWRFKPTAIGITTVEVETIANISFFLPGNDAAKFLVPYRKNVEKHPNDAKAHRTLGHELLNVGETKEAMEEFQKALSLDPQEANGHIDLGEALGAQGNLQAAIAEYRTGLSMKPSEAVAHYDLARILEKTGDLDAAIAEYRLGLQSQPKDGIRHFNLGILFMKKKDWDAAIAEFNVALHGDSTNPFAHFQLGLALEAKGDFAASAKELKRACNDMPQNENFRQALDRVTKESHP